MDLAQPTLFFILLLSAPHASNNMQCQYGLCVWLIKRKLGVLFQIKYDRVPEANPVQYEHSFGQTQRTVLEPMEHLVSAKSQGLLKYSQVIRSSLHASYYLKCN